MRPNKTIPPMRAPRDRKRSASAKRATLNRRAERDAKRTIRKGAR